MLVREACCLWLSTISPRSHLRHSLPGGVSQFKILSQLWGRNEYSLCFGLFSLFHFKCLDCWCLPYCLVTNPSSENTAFRMIHILNYFSCGPAFFLYSILPSFWLHLLCCPASSVEKVFPFNFMRLMKGIFIPSLWTGEEKPTSGGYSQLEDLFWPSLLWNPIHIAFCLNTLLQTWQKEALCGESVKKPVTLTSFYKWQASRLSSLQGNFYLGLGVSLLRDL